jgi:flagellar export protein FliJ
MRYFRFRLAPLLRLHEATRDEKRAQLAEAYRAEELLRERMREIDHELAGLKEECRQSAQPGAVDVDRLLDAQRYEVLMLAQRQVMQQHEQTLAAEIERRREALVAADREVRILEKLREKQQQEHRQAEHYEEVKVLDEVAARRPEMENS